MKALIIYHANCMDGFGAAWVAYKALIQDDRYSAVELLPAAYGDTAPTVDIDTEVFIVDFSYPAAVIAKLADTAANVVVLDHHKTAQANLALLESSSSLQVYFDMHRSGVGMTWDYFNPDKDQPWIVRHIQDRDLWRFEIPHTKEIHAWLAMQDKTIEVWGFAAAQLEDEDGYRAARECGHALLQQFDHQVDSIIKQCKEEVTICGHKGLGCNANGMFASEIGNILAKESGTFGATWFKGSDGAIKWSLRSEGNYDVSAIAAQFGGGGHKNAAGFTIYPESGLPQAGVTLYWKTEP